MAKVSTHSELPVRDFWDRLVHHFIFTEDGKISAEEKEFLDSDVLSLLSDCQDALSNNDIDLLKTLLAKFPSDSQWNEFKSNETVKLKAEMDEIKHDIELKLFVDGMIYPALNKCKNELDKKDVSEALKALQALPQDTEWPQSKQNDALKKVLGKVKSDLGTNLATLQQAPSGPVMSDKEKVQRRFDPLLASTQKDMDALVEIELVEEIDSYKYTAEQVEIMFKEVQLLRTEKTRMDTAPGEATDFSDVVALEEKLQKFTQNLVDSMYRFTQESIDIMTDPKTFHTNEPIVTQCINKLSKLGAIVTDVEQKNKIAELTHLFAQKQKDYPLIAQLGLKNEALITQLRHLCINQHNKLSAQKAPPVSVSGITGFLTSTLFSIDEYLLRPARYYDIQQAAKVKLVLTAGTYDIPKLIHKLAKKNSDELQKAFGISNENAEELEKLLYALSTYPANEEEIKEQLAWVERISNKLRKEPAAPVIQEDVKNDEAEDINETLHL